MRTSIISELCELVQDNDEVDLPTCVDGIDSGEPLAHCETLAIKLTCFLALGSSERACHLAIAHRQFALPVEVAVVYRGEALDDGEPLAETGECLVGPAEREQSVADLVQTD